MTGVQTCALPIYMLHLSLKFTVQNWNNTAPPIVVFGPSNVSLSDPQGILLGMAIPETPQPFQITNYGQTPSALFAIQLSPSAMETIESIRNGQGLTFTIMLRPEIRTESALVIGFEQVHCAVKVSDWLNVLKEANFGRSMLFEVPLIETPSSFVNINKHLEVARKHFALGHYNDVVATCRMALEALTQSLDQQGELKAALQLQKTEKQKLSRSQRELVMRQALTDFSSLAHHATDVPPEELFDRNAAQMALASTAALISSALNRHVAATRVA